MYFGTMVWKNQYVSSFFPRSMSKKSTSKQFFYSVFTGIGKGKQEKKVEQFLFALIVANVSLAILETTSFFPSSWDVFLFWFEAVSVMVFTGEYFTRLWVSPLYKGYEKGFFFNRMRFALRPMMLFDLLVILPFYLSFFFAIDIRWLRIFRLLRIFRTFRISAYSLAFERIFRVIKREKEELIATIWIMLVLLSIASSLLYLAERNVPGTDFTSIPASFWWGIATITTIGYGDMVPVTDMGRILGSISAILGVGFFALPTGLIGSSFYHDVATRRERQIKKLGQDIDILKVSAEESEGFMQELFERQNRKIRDLEKELLRAHEELRSRVPELQTNTTKKSSPRKKRTSPKKKTESVD